MRLQSQAKLSLPRGFLPQPPRLPSHRCGRTPFRTYADRCAPTSAIAPTVAPTETTVPDQRRSVLSDVCARAYRRTDGRTPVPAPTPIGAPFCTRAYRRTRRKPRFRHLRRSVLRLLNPRLRVRTMHRETPVPDPAEEFRRLRPRLPSHRETPVPTAAGTLLVTHGPTIVSIPSVDSDGDGTNDSYRADDVIRIEIGVSEQSCGDGALVITFQTGDGPSQIREAEYSECGPDSVYFEYRIADGDLDGDGISIAANSISLTTDGGDVLDATHPSVPPDPDHRVDAELVDTTPQDSPLVVFPPSPESVGSAANKPRSALGFGIRAE